MTTTTDDPCTCLSTPCRCVPPPVRDVARGRLVHADGTTAPIPERPAPGSMWFGVEPPAPHVRAPSRDALARKLHQAFVVAMRGAAADALDASSPVAVVLDAWRAVADLARAELAVEAQGVLASCAGLDDRLASDWKAQRSPGLDPEVELADRIARLKHDVIDLDRARVRVRDRVQRDADRTEALLTGALAEGSRLRDVIRTGGAAYRAERATMGLAGTPDFEGQPIGDVVRRARVVAAAIAWDLAISEGHFGDERAAEKVLRAAITDLQREPRALAFEVRQVEPEPAPPK